MNLPGDLITLDPFTRMYRALRTGLLADPGVVAAGLIRAGNTPDLSTDADRPIKEQLQDNDTPQVLLRPAQGRTQITSTNNTHLVTAGWSFEIESGEIHMHAKYLPAKWQIITAIIALRRNNPNLGYPEFVQRIALTGHSDTFDATAQSGRVQWIGAVGVEVVMYFTDNNLGLLAAVTRVQNNGA